ncbi:multicopper oxidase type 2 [Anaeromyxobacter sp. Fw109-5]|nr:multicopper oxidase type 2 [Anaeromyxobacter sp. Fw109-5]
MRSCPCVAGHVPGRSCKRAGCAAAKGDAMKGRGVILRLVISLALASSMSSASAQARKDKDRPRITHADRAAAAARAKAKGLASGAAAVAAAEMAMAMPGDPPRYYSHPNYANSPLPVVSGALVSVGNPLVDRAYATDFAGPVGELGQVFVVMPSAVLPEGLIQSFQTWNQATAGASPTPSAGGVFHAYVLRPTGIPNEYTVAFDSGTLTVPALADPTVGEVAKFDMVGGIGVQAGDLLAFYGQGIPVDTSSGSDVLSYPAPTAPLQGATITLGSLEYPIYPQARTYSFAAEVVDLSGTNVAITEGIRKFVDGLPGLGPDAANNLGQFIPVAVPERWPATDTAPESDYYVIELVEYSEQMHSDLPETKLRGYRQVNAPGGPTPPHYLGPMIVAQKNRPVRILFRNSLPTGAGGNLFVPVDTTVMGSGMTPAGHEMWPAEEDPQNPMCSQPGKEMMVASGHCFADNRATLHLHGGISPWISDGTPHQWVTPAGELTAYPEGVSVVDVPDMPAPGSGEMTFFYTNQQSARLMFYHDHAWGITRLNVYAGEAAPYVITDDTEKALVDSGIIPGAADTLPLVIQDKTFVPKAAQLASQDETWDVARWGGEGSLWMPHVYSPAQNPGDASGVNQFGRWAYGPWFWPPTTNVENGPMPNPYFDPACDPELTWCEPAVMPGVPYLSMGMESFQDTPVVNGTAYPTLTIDPKPYRLRVLNAANDRFFNLSLYKAVDANGALCDTANATPAPERTGVACTEVLLNPAEVAAALDDPAGVFPTPVAGTEGPDWIQIGTEGGFLPAPVVIPPHITTWVTDPTVFNAGNVDQHSLLLGPAERADVVVDFSQYAGQTLILYNDAPAAFPARDPRYDYYTGNPDLRDTGGAPSTLPGYGPNTRTVMQIKVRPGEGQPFDLGGLQAAFAHKPDAPGVFESGQHPIIVGQSAYNSAYGKTFQANGPFAGLVQIFDTSLTFDTLSDDPANPGTPLRLTIPLRPKMIQDEMGEAFEHEYGRMSGFLGVETANAQAGLQNMILYPFASPPTELVDGVELPGSAPALEVTPIASADDGTQVWKITHNGVDTHPIHFHLYEVQLLNRVGWDGIVRKPDLNELGWKETVRVSPLEDTVVALRPIIPHVPFDLPNSIRLLDPSMNEGDYLANTTLQESLGLPIFAFAPNGEPIDVVNHYVNYGAEYVWHCHILSHEEMDMMRPQAVALAPREPTGVTWALAGSGRNTRNVVSWTDASKNETGFVVERSSDGTSWTRIATVQSSELGVVPYVETGLGPGTGTVRTYADVIGNDRTPYSYRVYAINTVGDTWDYSNPALNRLPPGGGFPVLTVDSRGITTSSVAAPTNLTGSAAVRNRTSATVTLGWTDNSTESGFLIQRADNAGFTVGVVNATVAADVTTFKQNVARGRTYYYRVLAFTDAHQSAWSNTATVPTP